MFVAALRRSRYPMAKVVEIRFITKRILNFNEVSGDSAGKCDIEVINNWTKVTYE
jgi:hypothetical protein